MQSHSSVCQKLGQPGMVLMFLYGLVRLKSRCQQRWKKFWEESLLLPSSICIISTFNLFCYRTKFPFSLTCVSLHLQADDGGSVAVNASNVFNCPFFCVFLKVLKSAPLSPNFIHFQGHFGYSMSLKFQMNFRVNFSSSAKEHGWDFDRNVSNLYVALNNHVIIWGPS